MMRKISASYIFTLNGPPVKNGIVVVDNDGTIEEVLDTGGVVTEIAGLEYYSGVLVPGFVNAHCHLELAYLKGKLQPQKGLGYFLAELADQRNQTDEVEQISAAQKADHLLYHTGTIAVGDVSNTALTLKIKTDSNIYYHTFVECFGFKPERAERAMAMAETISSLFELSGLSCSITPHAPYSVSDKLFEAISDYSASKRSILSFHHQESLAENEMFRFKSGTLMKHLNEKIGLDTSFWTEPKMSSTKSSVPKIPIDNQLLLVHNTFLSHSELSELKTIRKKENTFLVLCPNSNLFIENSLPDLNLLRNSGFRICIGTDSFASNNNLSLLEEMKTLQMNFNIPLTELTSWACIHGAQALNIDHWAGSIEKGKRPGLNLITGLDLNHLLLKPQTKVKKMI